MTEAELLSNKKIGPELAAKYLQNGTTAHELRLDARDGTCPFMTARPGKGRYLRREHDPDDDLRAIGVNIMDRTKEIPVDDWAEEAVEGETGFGLWERMKMPGLFLALVCFIGASAHLELMDPMIAVPGMCLCSALFGWNARWR